MISSGWIGFFLPISHLALPLVGCESSASQSLLSPPPRRINIGSRYQAEVPELRQRSDVELDGHGAELVWAPQAQLEEKPEYQQKGEDSNRWPL